MLQLKLDESTADDLFVLLQELIDRAKENRNERVMSYVIPLLHAYGKALIQAKKGTPKKGYVLPIVRK